MIAVLYTRKIEVSPLEEDMSERMRYGLIGCGVIGPWHARSVGVVEDAELVAVCDIVKEKAEKLSEEHGGEVYTDYEKMLAEANLDIVSICTPSGLHHEMAIAAAKSGVHVLSEKPIDVKQDAMDKMIAACRENGVKLGCIFQRRTSPLWKKVRDIVQTGKLGKIVLGDAYLKYYRSPEYYASAEWRGTWDLDGGGCLMNQGVHCIDLMCWIMGDVDTVAAHSAPLARDIEVEDTAVAIVKYKSGALGVIEGTTSVAPGMRHRLEFHGEHGTLRVEGESIVELNSTLISDEEKEKLLAPPESAEKDDTASDPRALGIKGHITQVQDIIDAVREDRDPMVPGENARKSVELILGIYESSRKNGEPVTLN